MGSEEKPVPTERASPQTHCYFVSPQEVISFVDAMMKDPDIFLAFQRAGMERDFTRQEARLISDFLELERTARAGRRLNPDYGLLSAGIVVLRQIMNGEYSGLDDPKLGQFLVRVLRK